MKTIISRINKTFAALFLLGFAEFVIREIFSRPKEPDLADIIATALMMLSVWWFIARGLWLVVSEMTDLHS